MAWIIIGSPGGLINGLLVDGLGLTWLKLDIYSAVGIVWIQVLHITPFTFFSVRAPLSTMDAGLEEAAYMAGATPWQAACKVTVPLMIYPLLSGLLLSFVLAVEQFADLPPWSASRATSTCWRPSSTCSPASPRPTTAWLPPSASP